MNRYHPWKYILIGFIVVVGIIFALPNIYGKDPALQVSASGTLEVTELNRLQVVEALDQSGIVPTASALELGKLIFRFDNEEIQLQAQPIVQQALGNNYIVALNLAAATPGWLRSFGAEPMFLGLDLRGGVHFLMEVDMDAAVLKADERNVSNFRTLLRENKIRYKTITLLDEGGTLVRFRDAEQRESGIDLINENYIDLNLDSLDTEEGEYGLRVTLTDSSILETQRSALQQNITTLRNRVNELGVAEPVIQQQGLNRIVVQLPGVQDTARAKEILGATATLEFRMVDEERSVLDAVDGRVPASSKLYYDRAGQPVLLQKEVMLTGDYVINAASGIDSVSGGPSVTIDLDSKGASIFSRKTREEVGKSMGIIYIENKSETVEEDGELVRKTSTDEKVISVAVIREQLSKRFQITGLDSTSEARNLALFLRAGALAAPVQIVEERTVGPSLGQDNIDRGMQSVAIGFVLVLIFMLVYYKIFGIAANIALTLNLVLLVALLSLLQATLTLPGIAGIVLTVGMAVDANVLIFQRIKEELKNGNSPQSSIHAGYEKAFSTIADANITTLIAALVLFSFGTGPIKGFAVTLSLGIICSMFTAIMVTRAIINTYYGGRKVEKLFI